MKEKILDILKSYGRALSFEEIDSSLNIKTVEETEELISALRELEESVEIYHSNKDKYMIFENSNLRKGIMRTNKKGFGFVDISNQEEDIFVSMDNMNGAINGDTVLVEIISNKPDGRIEGRIVRVVKRELSTVVGEIYFKKERGYLIPDDKKLKMNIEIPKGKNLGSVDGHKVVVKITNQIGNNKFKGEVVRILGHKNDIGVDILSIVCNYNIKDTFDEDTIKELDNIPEEVSESDKKGRRDLTGEVIFTIDAIL